MREMELQVDLTELFEPEGYNAFEWKKQIGGIAIENCCNCHNQQW